MSFEEWKEVRLEDVCSFVTGKLNSNAAETNGKYPFFTCSPETLQINSFAFDQEAILLAGNNAEGKFNVKYYHGKFNAYQRTYVISVKREDMINFQFLYYMLQINLNHLRSLSIGTATKYLTAPIISGMKLRLPSLNIQKEISRILNRIDKKIHLNNQINQKLEQMAQAIFKSWFIDFEPFQDGEFIDSELGRIPKGWKVGNFNSLVQEMGGGDWGKKEPEHNYNLQVDIIRGADIPEIEIGNRGKCPTRYILEKNLSKKKLQSGDLVIEISGGSPTQSTGRVLLVTNTMLSRFNNPLICTNFCKRIMLCDQNYSMFMYYYLKYLYLNDIFFQFENGTTGIKNLDLKGFLENYFIAIPPVTVVDDFNSLVYKKVEKIRILGEQSQTLTTLRDTLLPKLMSGEIRVPSTNEGG
jgi:type I restriction enzyme, S subunit